MAKKKDSENPNNEKEKITRVSSGIPGLDEMIEGGFVKNSTTLIQGGAGAAKTLFCLQHIYHGATQMEEPAVFLSFNESEKSIIRHGNVFGWDFRKLIEEKKFMVVHFQPREIARIVEEGSNVIWDTIESIGAKRLVVDSLTAYGMYFEKQYLADQSILSIFQELEKRDITALLTMENLVNPTKESGDRAEFLTDGVINLYNLRKNKAHYRALEIVKMRDTDHSSEIKLFSVDKSGIKILNNQNTSIE